LPVPHHSAKKVKSSGEEKVKFPTPPEPEKVKSESRNKLESLQNMPNKVVETKEREEKEAAEAVSLSPHNGADAPELSFISPEVARKFHLRYGIEEWPPQRRKD
jgi:hypothetical protein